MSPRWLMCFALCVQSARAEAPSREAIVEGVGRDPLGDPPSAEETERRAGALAAVLRCPVCQGLSVADSPSDAARAMFDRIREMVSVGYTDEQITDYFIDRYGAWIQLAPPQEQNPVLWWGPWVVLGLGLGAVGAVAWRRRDAVVAPAVAAPPATVADDPHRQKILEELGD